jgi:phosphonate transport system ATP-binding protein
VPKNIIEVNKLTKVYDTGTRALDKVSLDVPKGQMLALIGLSGSGKSTFLRHLNGLTRPSTGQIEVLGVDVVKADKRQLRELRRQVGFIFQQFGLVGRLTAIENVLAGALGSLKGPRFGVGSYPIDLRRRALEHLDRVGLADYAFQRTLMQQPSIMLADEPVASLDPESSSQVMDIMLRVAKEENLTVLVTLHQIEYAMGWADRIVGLRDGRVVLDDEPKKLGKKKVMEVYQRVATKGIDAAQLAEESLRNMRDEGQS